MTRRRDPGAETTGLPRILVDTAAAIPANPSTVQTLTPTAIMPTTAAAAALAPSIAVQIGSIRHRRRIPGGGAITIPKRMTIIPDHGRLAGGFVEMTMI
jgi:hypothetical protein